MSTFNLFITSETLLKGVSPLLWVTAWAFGSFLWVECVRDLFHILAHQWLWLTRHHGWHHRVFNRDMSMKNMELYRRSQWHHDVPEAIVMLLFAITYVVITVLTNSDLSIRISSCYGVLYTLRALILAVGRGLGLSWGIAVDVNHQAPESMSPPSKWSVNWSYHQRHHFENANAYYSGVFTVVDRLSGTALSLKGKKVAVTGASGTLGQELLKQLTLAGAYVVALTSSSMKTMYIEVNGQHQAVDTVSWSVGQENALVDLLKSVDVLVLNHGVNIRQCTATAAQQMLEVNILSTYRLLEHFLATVQTPFDAVRKEAWVVTSDAEVVSAKSPLYEMSKQMLGKLVTSMRIDAPCILRKIVVGDFQSAMSPQGRLSAAWVAKQIVKAAQCDIRNIVVSPWRPWVYVLYPIHEWLTSQSYKSSCKKK
ncbi:MAG: bifunctional sterol desaturase/short chain dehydrogenase [Cyanobacteria bacterium P01_H01_bin.105]